MSFDKVNFITDYGQLFYEFIIGDRKIKNGPENITKNKMFSTSHWLNIYIPVVNGMHHSLLLQKTLAPLYTKRSLKSQCSNSVQVSFTTTQQKSENKSGYLSSKSVRISEYA